MCKEREVPTGKLKWFNDAREGGDGRLGYCAGLSPGEMETSGVC